MKRMPVEVTGITVWPPYSGYMLILKEIHGPRWLPIFIGQFEAQNIHTLQKGGQTPRPFTFDLFGSLLDVASVRVSAVTITELRDSTFYAEIALQLPGGNTKLVDARPSDAVALALRMRSPIYVADTVLEEAGQSDELNIGPADNDKLARLNQRLQEAVANEHYEEAARIRDQIRALEEETAGNG